MGLAAVILTAKYKCSPSALALEDDSNRKFAIADDPRQRLALLNTNADSDLTSEASWTSRGHLHTGDNEQV